MAYLLRFDGNDDHVTLNSEVGGAFADRNDIAQDWVLEFQFKRSGSDSYSHWFFDVDGSREDAVYRASDGLFRLRLIAGDVTWNGVTTNTTDPATFRIIKAGGSNAYELLVDDGTGGGFVSYGTDTASVQIFNFDVIGKSGASSSIDGDLYYVSYTTTNSGVDFYADPSASGGTGSILPDTIGSNDGTLVNFPTDNSQWVFYPSGGGGVENVVPDNVSQTNAITQAILTQNSALQIDSLSQSVSLSQPTLSQNQALILDDVSNAHGMTEPALSQQSALQSDGVNQGQSMEQPTLAQAHILSPASIHQASTLAQSGLTAEGSITPFDVTQANALAISTMIQNHSLIPASVSQSASLHSVGLGQGFTLVVNNVNQANVTGQPSLTSFNGLVVQGLGQVQSLDDSGLAQHQVLVTNPITQQQTIGTVVFEKEPRIGRLRASFGKYEINARFALSEISATFGVN